MTDIRYKSNHVYGYYLNHFEHNGGIAFDYMKNGKRTRLYYDYDDDLVLIEGLNYVL